MVDAGALGIGFAGLAAKSAPLAMIGYGTWVASGPSAHLAHGNPGRALGSVGMRLSLPVLGAVVGCRLSPPDPFLGCTEGIATGFLAGMGIATVLDAAVAWRGTTGERDVARRSRITPTIVAGDGVRGFGLTGAF